MDRTTVVTEPTERVEPCRYMRIWVSELADGSLRGLARWYTELHVKGCPHCKPAFEAIRVLRVRLQSIAEAPPENERAGLAPHRAEAVAAALDSIDAGRQPETRTEGK